MALRWASDSAGLLPAEEGGGMDAEVGGRPGAIVAARRQKRAGAVPFLPAIQIAARGWKRGHLTRGWGGRGRAGRELREGSHPPLPAQHGPIVHDDEAMNRGPEL